MDKVSVVIISRNNADSVIKTLVSLEKQTYKNFSVIIVDCGSTDNLPTLLSQYQRWATPIKIKFLPQKNISYEEATLIGNQNSDGGYLYVMEPIIIPPNALQDFVDNSKKNNSKNSNPVESIVPFLKRTPFNTKKKPFSIFIGCSNYSYWTGMPVYIFNISREFIKMGHVVTIVSETIGGDITKMTNDLGIETYNSLDKRYLDKEYDVLLLNEPESEKYLSEFPNIPAWNYIHSKMEVDTPISPRPQIMGYLTQRENTKKYWEDELGIKMEIIPLPVNLEKFKPQKNRLKRSSKYKILVPGTFHVVREKMIYDIIKRAKNDKNIEVLFKGSDSGLFGEIEKKIGKFPKNIKTDFTESYDIERYIDWADEVDGIYMGLVTIEAWAMNKKTMVYDDDGNGVMIEKPKDFEEKHSSLSVAKRFIELFNRKWADIVIPHHDRPELLQQALKSIPLRNYNVIIVRGGTFSQSCNRGAKLANTDRIIFANDDLILNPQTLWELVQSDSDIMGVPQYYPTGELLCVGIKIDKNCRYQLTETVADAMYPSGAIFMIKRKIFEDVGGFDERYKNGGEDQDLFLRLLEKKYSLSFTKGSVIHYCSQSTGRFDYIIESDDILSKDWTNKRLSKII